MAAGMDPVDTAQARAWSRLWAWLLSPLENEVDVNNEVSEADQTLSPATLYGQVQLGRDTA
jgi:hypothetical protein